jgi:hypothetical protein
MEMTTNNYFIYFYVGQYLPFFYNLADKNTLDAKN